MSKYLCATAAVAFIAAVAAAPASGFAQTAASCDQARQTTADSQAMPPHVADGATCEDYVRANGKMVLQNGPNAQDPDMPDAPHESP